MGAFPSRPKKQLLCLLSKSGPWMGPVLRACAAQGWRSGGRCVTEAHRYKSIIYHYITLHPGDGPPSEDGRRKNGGPGGGGGGGEKRGPFSPGPGGGERRGPLCPGAGAVVRRGASGRGRGGGKKFLWRKKTKAGDISRMADRPRSSWLLGWERRRCPIASRYDYGRLKFFITLRPPASGGPARIITWRYRRGGGQKR